LLLCLRVVAVVQSGIDEIEILISRHLYAIRFFSQVSASILLHSGQSAYRPFHFSGTAVRRIDCGQIYALVLLDLSSLLDTLDCDVFLCTQTLLSVAF
jgi:hypothetical protein